VPDQGVDGLIMAKDSKANGAAGNNQNRDSDLNERRERLSKALEGQRKQEAAHQPKQSGATGYAQALKVGSEFVGGVLVGVALGWGLDSVAGTSPWGLIIFLMLGFAAGVLNVIRGSGSMNTSGNSADTEQERRSAGTEKADRSED
jgi:ATP synthase protein I